MAISIIYPAVDQGAPPANLLRRSDWSTFFQHSTTHTDVSTGAPAHYKWNFVVIYSLSVIYIDWSMFFQLSTTHTTVSTGALLRIINGNFVVILYISVIYTD